MTGPVGTTGVTGAVGPTGATGAGGATGPIIFSLYDAFTVVNFPFSTDFLDTKGNAAAPSSSSGVSISGAKAVFAGSSGNGLQYDSISVPGVLEGVAFGSGPFTIEGWFQTSSTLAYATLLEHSDASFTAGAWSLMVNGDGVTNSGLLAFWLRDFSGSAPLILSTAGTKYNDGARHHVRVVRIGNQFTMAVDGVMLAHVTFATAITDATMTVKFGYSQAGSRAIAATLDNWRILKGFAASSVKFTVPTPPFPVV